MSGVALNYICVFHASVHLTVANQALNLAAFQAAPNPLISKQQIWCLWDKLLSILHLEGVVLLNRSWCTSWFLLCSVSDSRLQHPWMSCLHMHRSSEPLLRWSSWTMWDRNKKDTLWPKLCTRSDHFICTKTKHKTEKQTSKNGLNPVSGDKSLTWDPIQHSSLFYVCLKRKSQLQNFKFKSAELKKSCITSTNAKKKKNKRDFQYLWKTVLKLCKRPSLSCQLLQFLVSHTFTHSEKSISYSVSSAGGTGGT